jgi:hypothetical protein
MVGLGQLFVGINVATRAASVSADGRLIVGTAYDRNGEGAAIVWDPTHGLRPLQALARRA